MQRLNVPRVARLSQKVEKHFAATNVERNITNGIGQKLSSSARFAMSRSRRTELMQSIAETIAVGKRCSSDITMILGRRMFRLKNGGRGNARVATLYRKVESSFARIIVAMPSAKGVVMEMPIFTVKMYRPSDLAEMLGVTKYTISRWKRHCVLPPPVKIGGRLYWSHETIQEWLATKGVKNVNVSR